MPTYTYRCTNCDHEFEARQRMTEVPLTECPVCKGKVRRVVNSVGVVFKGKGFYVTDNRGKTALPPANSKKEEGGPEKSAVSSSGAEASSSTSTTTSSSDSGRSGGGDATSKSSKTEKTSS